MSPKPKIFISSSTFAKADPAPYQLLLETGWEIQTNPFGRVLKPEEILELAPDANAILASTESFHDTIEQFSNLQMISRTGIGLDSIPLARCRELGITIHYTPDAVTDAVAEMGIGSMILLSRKIIQADREIKSGQWNRHIGKSIHESQIGIIGFGRIGKALVRMLQGFKPKQILLNDIRDIQTEAVEFSKKYNLKIQVTNLETLLQSADFITVHVPKTKQTMPLLQKKELNLMKQEAFLMNFSRGGVIAEKDLQEALEEKRIQGVALDVFEQEPYSGKLCNLESTVLTAHMGSCSKESRFQMDMQAAQAILNFFQGLPLLNPVTEIPEF